MASFNRVILVGNLTRDVELRTAGQTSVTDIGLAVNEKVKKGNEWVDEACFIDVTLWGKTAEVASQYLSKGSPVLIEGRLKLEQWTDKEGRKCSKHKIIADKMQMLGGGKGGERQPATAGASQTSGDDASFGDDEIPF